MAAAPQTAYAYAGGPLELDQSGTTYWYIADTLGSVRLVTDSTGASPATYSYSAFGSTRASTGTLANEVRFTGERTDTESGLEFLRARTYDPYTGTFLQRDSIGLLDYLYGAGDPINALDPSGKCAVSSSDYGSCYRTENGGMGGSYVSDATVAGATASLHRRGAAISFARGVTALGAQVAKAASRVADQADTIVATYEADMESYVALACPMGICSLVAQSMVPDAPSFDQWAANGGVMDYGLVGTMDDVSTWLLAKGGKQHITHNDDFIKDLTPDQLRDIQRSPQWRTYTPQQKQKLIQEQKAKGVRGKRTHFEGYSDDPTARVAATAATAAGGAGAAGLLWWLFKAAAPLCGPAVLVCAVGL